MDGFPTGTDEYQLKHKVITQKDSLGSNDQTSGLTAFEALNAKLVPKTYCEPKYTRLGQPSLVRG